MSRKVKNLEVNIIFSPISYQHGMAGSQRLNNLVKVLEESNINCKNLIFSEEILNFSMTEKSAFIPLKRKYFEHVILNPVTIFFALLKLKEKGKNIFYNYGYIHIKNILVITIAKLLGYRIVIDVVEDNFAIVSFKNKMARIRIKSSLFFFKHLSIIVNGVVVINMHLHRLLVKYNSNSIPNIQIPISIDAGEFIKDPFRNNLNIFYGGSFGEKDGLSFLLKAFDEVSERFPESRLIITGKGRSIDMNRFNGELNSVRYKDHVILKGYLSRNQYLELLQSCCVNCMTRTNSDYANGGFPFKLGEMLASGVPVIATEIGEIGNYFINYKSIILIKPESVNELVKSIEFVFQNKEVASLIGKEGRKVAFDFFDLRLQKDQIISFLNRV